MRTSARGTVYERSVARRSFSWKTPAPMSGPRSKKTALSTFAVVLASLCASTCTDGARAQIQWEETRAKQVKLSNGLTVILEEDHTAPVVGLELRYGVGTRDERPEQGGLAALVQRLMVHGTKHVHDGDYDRLLEAAGAFDSSYTTGLDRTTFRVSVPSDRLALPLWLWSDQMAFLGPRIDDAAIGQARTAVLNERAQKVDGAPAGRVRELVFAELYPAGHPYRGYTLRASSALDTLAPADVRAFFEPRYGPDDTILALVGDFETAHALEIVERYFGPIPPTDGPSRAAPSRPRPTGVTRLQVSANVETAILHVNWSTPELYAPGDPELALAAELLAGRRAGWLRWSLVDRLKIASEVSAHQYSRELGSDFEIRAIASRGHTADEMLTAVDDVLRSIQSQPPSAEYVHAALTEHVVGPLVTMEQVGARASRRIDCELLDIHNACIERAFTLYSAVADVGPIEKAIRDELPLDRRVVTLVTPASDAPRGGQLRGKTGP
jgi:zinc protease